MLTISFNIQKMVVQSCQKVGIFASEKLITDRYLTENEWYYICLPLLFTETNDFFNAIT